MVMEIADLKGRVNYLTKFLSEVKFVLRQHPELLEQPDFKNIIDIMDQQNIKQFYALNWD